MLETLQFLWLIVKILHVWLILSAAITIMALKEGLVQVAVVFGGLFVMLLYFNQDEILSIETVSRIFLALIVGLVVAFCIWVMKD
jgi:hypothetical protein